MKNLISVPQNAEDLLLAVLEKDALPKLRVLRSERLLIGDWRFEFAIIGESHTVRIEHGGRLLMLEVLACIDVAQTACKVYQPFSAKQAFAYHESRYQVAVNFSEALPIWTQADNHLRYEFPLTHGQIPETRIQWQLGSGRVTWQTLHSYPDAGGMLVVLSESEFRLA